MLTGGKIILIKIFELFFTRAFHSEFSSSFSHSFKRGKSEVRVYNDVMPNRTKPLRGENNSGNKLFCSTSSEIFDFLLIFYFLMLSQSIPFIRCLHLMLVSQNISKPLFIASLQKKTSSNPS